MMPPGTAMRAPGMAPPAMPPGTAMRGPGMMPPMMPPGTAMRGMMPPGTAGMMPPGTGIAPPGTGMVPPGTAGMAAMMSGTVLGTNIKVDARPVTGAAQGMTGMKTAGGQGPGRQIYDRSYYIGLLRAKQSELNQEIERIHQKWDGLQTDHASFFKLANRQQTLEDEVKRLQGNLGNFNLMVDKAHTSSDPEEVEKEYRRLKTVNEAETKKIDAIITDRSEIERRARDIESAITKHQAQVQEKMDELPEDKRELWFQLQEEDRQLTSEISTVQNQADEVRQSILEQEDLLKRDPLKKQALDLTQSIQSKEGELEDLMESTAHLRLSFPEQKKLLLDHVKRDADSIRKMEEEIKELKDEISGFKDRLHEMNTDLAENQAGTQEDNQKKMMDFYRKMQDELTSYPATKQQEEADIKVAQQQTVSLLEYISRLEGRSGNLPDAQQHAEMQGELKFKQQQMEQAGQTAEIMDQELLKVKEEAEKLAGIDQKIETEMAQLETRTKEYIEELEVYADMKKLEDECALKKQKLKTNKSRLQKHLDTLNVQLQQTKANHDETTKFLRDDETHNNITELTKSLTAHEQNIYSLNDYVEEKSQQSDYRQAKENVTQMTADLNKICIHSLRI